MSRKTYGVPRLVDWGAQIKAGGATVRVHFTGGALTAYGVTPAEYTTEDPFIQRVIEQSSHFRAGRIILLREAGSEEPTPRKRKRGKDTVVHPEERTGGGAAEAEKPATPSPEDEARDEEATPAEGGEPTTAQESGMEVVEVTCLQDAQAYLQEHYGIASHKVRTCEAAQQAGNEHGVRFSGSKF